MIGVIFEVIPAHGSRVEYLELAASLKAELVKIKGFISIERFQSLSDPKKILSLSFWDSETAIQEWRNLELHRKVQKTGRNKIFKAYRLRVGHVIRDYGMNERAEAPQDSLVYHMRCTANEGDN